MQLTESRIKDAQLVRELFVTLTNEQPVLPLNRRLAMLHAEITKRVPSGAFYHLQSFYRREPSIHWIAKVLMGRVGKVVLGPSLLPVKAKRGPYAPRGGGTGRLNGSYYFRLRTLEALVEHLCISFGVDKEAVLADSNAQGE